MRFGNGHWVVLLVLLAALLLASCGGLALQGEGGLQVDVPLGEGEQESGEGGGGGGTASSRPLLLLLIVAAVFALAAVFFRQGVR